VQRESYSRRFGNRPLKSQPFRYLLSDTGKRWLFPICKDYQLGRTLREDWPAELIWQSLVILRQAACEVFSGSHALPFGLPGAENRLDVLHEVGATLVMVWLGKLLAASAVVVASVNAFRPAKRYSEECKGAVGRDRRIVHSSVHPSHFDKTDVSHGRWVFLLSDQTEKAQSLHADENYAALALTTAGPLAQCELLNLTRSSFW